MRPQETESYVPAFKLHAPLENFAVVEVLRSENERFSKGQRCAYLFWETYFVSVHTHRDRSLQALWLRQVPDVLGTPTNLLRPLVPFRLLTARLPFEQVIPKEQAESLRVVENKEKLPWTTWYVQTIARSPYSRLN